MWHNKQISLVLSHEQRLDVFGRKYGVMAVAAIFYLSSSSDFVHISGVSKRIRLTQAPARICSLCSWLDVWVHQANVVEKIEKFWLNIMLGMAAIVINNTQHTAWHEHEHINPTCTLLRRNSTGMKRIHKIWGKMKCRMKCRSLHWFNLQCRH